MQRHPTVVYFAGFRPGWAPTRQAELLCTLCIEQYVAFIKCLTTTLCIRRGVRATNLLCDAKDRLWIMLHEVHKLAPLLLFALNLLIKSRLVGDIRLIYQCSTVLTVPG